ncbi:methylmalonyl-CoA mutase family protein [Rummeliibacillus pycnus]|uniref:methylmalonyl-CoA mutase family protein n=1 Tax=Rummeliibacillus pycnus TaxID=101070 RepID=UPI003D29498F
MTKMKEVEFTKPSYDEWKESAIQALKGKPFESLFTKTIEGITLEPLYTAEGLMAKVDGKLEEQVSTIRAMQTEGEFGIAQEAFGDSIEEFIAQTEDSLERGNQYVTVGKVNFEWSDRELKQLASLLEKHPFVINVVDPDVINVFNYIENKEVKGFILSNGTQTIHDFPNVRKLNAYIQDAHYQGANAVQELTIALAKASELAGDMNFTEFEKQFFVSFSIDTKFFMEIAKIRAFRLLWKAFANAYGVEKPQPVKILAETSLRSFSKLDVYVNLLRAGNEAFSAVLGGADVVTVHPHDVLTKPTNQSIRIARNVSLVIKEESHVTKVLDPTGGSYYIESLTHDLVKEAWAKFVEIEEAGGYSAYVASGNLQKELEEVMAKRIQDVERRKTVLVGTNDFANAQEEVPTESFYDVNRIAKPFEDLRQEFKKSPINVTILTFGHFKNIKPRTDFVKGVFATAGITAEVTDPFTDVEKAKEWLSNTTANYVVFSAIDEDTKGIIPALLSAKPGHVLLDVAGKFDEDWESQGLNGFVYAGQNIIEKLQGIQENLKEVQR